MLKKTCACAALAMSFAAFPAASETIYVETAPPSPPAETLPGPREGFVWAPGYYVYRDNSYSWVGGHWEPARKGYRYVAPSWVQDQGRWRYTDEQWIQDEDHTYGRNGNRANRER